MTAAPAEIVEFWREAGPDKWYVKEGAFDATFRETFLDTHLAAAGRRLDAWADEPEGSLALMILLDQFPRNCFRGTAHMFATDPLARSFARRAVEASQDAAFEADLRQFFYMPFMHSEALEDQEHCVGLFHPLGEAMSKYAVEHRDIIARFGRFPHRNRVLARDTTPEEQAFLDSGGFAG